MHAVHAVAGRADQESLEALSAPALAVSSAQPGEGRFNCGDGSFDVRDRNADVRTTRVIPGLSTSGQGIASPPVYHRCSR